MTICRPSAPLEELLEINRVPVETRDPFIRGLQVYLQDRGARGKKLRRDEMLGLFDTTGAYNVIMKSNAMVGIENRVEPEHKAFYRRVGRGCTILPLCLGEIPSIQKLEEGCYKVEKRFDLHAQPWREDMCEKIQLKAANGNDTNGLFLKRCIASSTLAGKKMCAEVAAYKLSILLHLNIVPPTRFVMYKGRVYSGQDLVDTNVYCLGPEPHKVPQLQQQLQEDPAWTNGMSDLWAFDYIGAINDRQAQNLFFSYDDHAIMAIDHESGFTHVIPKVPSDTTLFLSGGRLPPLYSSTIRSVLPCVTWEGCIATFKDLLPEDVIEAMWLRMKVVIADMDSKV